MLRYMTRPISDRTWQTPNKRITSAFTTTWSATLDLLDREYAALRGRDLVIEVDVAEKDIRNDGLLRADAKAASPAVVVAFGSRHGPLLYRCDQYIRQAPRSSMVSWQHNIRAIALTLEALRSVDRHGASAHGEQYRGYKAIDAGDNGGAARMTRLDAERLIAALSGIGHRGMPSDPDGWRRLARMARANVHPDRGGSRDAWDDVERAVAVLRVQP